MKQFQCCIAQIKSLKTLRARTSTTCLPIKIEILYIHTINIPLVKTEVLMIKFHLLVVNECTHDVGR